MQSTVSFHAVDLDFFDNTIEPLIAGQKINPESYIDEALRLFAAGWRAQGYRAAFELQLELLQPPPPSEDGTMWDKLRGRLERLDFKPAPLSRLVGEHIDPELHIYGRPFLITEGSADRVAATLDEYRTTQGDQRIDALILEQLLRLDKELGKQLEAEQLSDPPNDMTYRAELLAALEQIFELAHAARRDDSWAGSAGREPARQALLRELPWRAVQAHARIHPFWIARDVDGLATVCSAAGIAPPEVLVPPRRLLAAACEEFEGLRESLAVELATSPCVGAYVPPADVPELLEFLQSNGSKIIRVATQHGEGATCSTLLRKIRECATYAQKQQRGYLEAGGIVPREIEIGTAVADSL